MPALSLLRRELPEVHLTLAVHESAAGLLPAIPAIDGGIVFGPRRGWTPWQQTLTGGFDVALDFTGSDRSALVAGLSRADRRLAFRGKKSRRLRASAYNEFVDSSARDLHTADYNCELVRPLISPDADPARAAAMNEPLLRLPPAAREQAARLRQSAGIRGAYTLVHPGTARAEKYWQPDRWARVIAHCQSRFGLPCILTGGSDPFERAHLAAIESALPLRCPNFAGQLDLATLTALAAEASLVLSVDTAVAHLAAAFQRPQIVLFGPTNPFHWRPRHARVIILSAACGDGPVVTFQPKLARAAMDRISTETVIHATDSLFSQLSAGALPL